MSVRGESNTIEITRCCNLIMVRTIGINRIDITISTYIEYICKVIPGIDSGPSVGRKYPTAGRITYGRIGCIRVGRFIEENVILASPMSFQVSLNTPTSYNIHLQKDHALRHLAIYRPLYHLLSQNLWVSQHCHP